MACEVQVDLSKAGTSPALLSSIASIDAINPK
jgi:hypothetical protein